jgi:RNA polymerase sigma factor (TIGR02999 family)
VPAGGPLLVKVKFAREMAHAPQKKFQCRPDKAARPTRASPGFPVDSLTFNDDGDTLRWNFCGGDSVSGVSSKSVTQLLERWAGGDEGALKSLVPLVYDELRRQARQYFRKERPDHTLQSTALVHEAYLRLCKQGPTQFANREHFFAVAAQLMRQILVEHARRHRAAKRGGGHKLALDEAVAPPNTEDLDLVALDDALQELARLDARQSQIVELRFFAGLSIAEIARVLRISPATVKRDWVTARTWLHHAIRQAANL